jgi:hypothetical protein
MGGAKRYTEPVLMYFVEQDEESSDKNDDEGSEDKEEPEEEEEEEEEELEDPKEKLEEGKCIYFSVLEVCFHVWNQGWICGQLLCCSGFCPRCVEKGGERSNVHPAMRQCCKCKLLSKWYTSGSNAGSNAGCHARCYMRSGQFDASGG